MDKDRNDDKEEGAWGDAQAITSSPEEQGKEDSNEEAVRRAVREEFKKRYTGVKGWLLFICILFLLIVPLAAISSFYNSIAVIYGSGDEGFGEIIPTVQENWNNVADGVNTVVAVDSILSAITVSMLAISGYKLWRIRPNAVKFTKIALLVVMGYNIAGPFLLLLLDAPTFGGDDFAQQVGRQAAPSILVITTLFLYFTKSERVRNTYEHTG